MKNKKGFTLAELLGVIVILSVILLLVGIPLSKRLKSGSETVYESQLKVIEIGTENWISENKDSLPVNDGESITLTVGNLKQEGLIETDIVNPITGECIPNNTEVKITRENGKYKIDIDIDSGTDECPDIDTATPIIYLNGEAYEYVEFGSTFVDKGATAKTSTGVIIDDVKATVTKNGPTINTRQFKEYEITYTATDNGITVTVKRGIKIVDTTPPTLVIPADSVISTEVTSINLRDGISANDLADGDLTSQIVVTGTVSPGVLGEYVITYEVTDSHGNKTTATRKITIEDKTKPTSSANIVGDPLNENGWANEKFKVRITVNDTGGSGVGGFKYCQTTSSTCTPSNVVTYTRPNSHDHEIEINQNSGTNRICVIPFDNAGNEGNKVCYGPYKLDKVKPNASLSINTSRNSTGWYLSNISISVNTSDTGTSNVQYYKYCKSTSNKCTPSERVNKTSDTQTISTEGENNYLCVISVDYAGNESDRECVGPLKMDKTPPTLTLTPKTDPNSNGWYKANVEFNIQAGDSGPSGYELYKYCISTSGECTPSNNIYLTSDTKTISSPGDNNYICAYSRDNAGNTSEKKCKGPIKLDKKEPTVSYSNVTITQFDEVDVWSGISYSDDYTATSTLTNSRSSSGNLNNQVAGTYNVNYSLTDLAGNVKSFSRTYTVNPKPVTVDVNPVINGTTHGGGVAGFTFDVYLNGSLVADNVTDWYQTINWGTRVQVNGNGHTGYTYNGGNYDGYVNSNIEIKPTWSVNSYTVNYYVYGSLWAQRTVAYEGTIENLTPSGMFDAYHHFNYWEGMPGGYKMPANNVNLYANIGEAHCSLTTGHASYSNAVGLAAIFEQSGWHATVTRAVPPYDSYWLAITDTALTRAQADQQRENIGRRANSNGVEPWIRWIGMSCENGHSETWVRSSGQVSWTVQ